MTRASPRPTFDGERSLTDLLRRHEESLKEPSSSAHVGVVKEVAISPGVAVSPRAPALDRARKLGIPIVPRSSGGSIVVARPGDILWSVSVPRTHPEVDRKRLHAYTELGAGVVDALDAFGLVAAWSPPLALSDEFCLLGPRGEVLTVNGRVLGGAAQRRTSAGLLHHGILVRSVDWRLLATLFDLPVGRLESTITGFVEAGISTPSPTMAQRLLSLIGSMTLSG